MNIFESVVLGAIEGLTEFLPVSSTGHLILASALLGIEQSDFHKAYEVIIQLGSILAIVFLYRDKLFHSIELWKRLIVAFIPTGVLGLLLYKHIKALFSADVVAYMLIFGGIIFIVLELLHKEKDESVDAVEKISYKQAVAIGFFQSLAMVPGTSRSGATIIGGLLLGLKRKTAAEFSFLLAVPTMLIATVYDVYKNHHTMQLDNVIVLVVGFVTAFLFAIVAVKGLLAFISRFNFIPFGIYRIIVGIVFLFFLGIV